MKSLLSMLFVILFLSHTLFAGSQAERRQDEKPPETISIVVNLDQEVGEMHPLWAWFGHDEPNYTYMKDGKKLLSELASLSEHPVYVRTHNLLTSGDGTPALKWGSTNAYTENAQGKPIYNWTILDKIFNTYIERGIKPLVEIGFMPEALSTNPKPYQHQWAPDQPTRNIYTGWAYPPKDYTKWEELIYQWVKHSMERYGANEVQTWYWEVWNEPDGGYWKGTVEEYCKLYDFSAKAVKRALPRARVGGPHVTGPVSEKAAQFLKQFLTHCVDETNFADGSKGAPLDFIAFHAKGSPKVVQGHVQMNMGRQLASIAKGFEVVASFPSLRSLPVILGESDPEGCAACSMDFSPQNAYRNGTMYSSYTAASFARKYALADHYRINLTGAVTWAFEFENQPWFRGFRDLATNGVDKAVLNVFRMFGLMKGKRVAVTGDLPYDFKKIMDSGVRGDQPDVGALASTGKSECAVLLWNYHDDDLAAIDSVIRVTLKGLPAARVLLHHYRIDRDHSNSYECWKRMGSPQKPSPEQVAQLASAGQLQLLSSPEWLHPKELAAINVILPRQGVSLLHFSWNP